MPDVRVAFMRTRTAHHDLGRQTTPEHRVSLLSIHSEMWITLSQPHMRKLGGAYFSRSNAASLITCGFTSLNLWGSRGIWSGTFCQKKNQSHRGCKSKHRRVTVKLCEHHRPDFESWARCGCIHITTEQHERRVTVGSWTSNIIWWLDTFHIDNTKKAPEGHEDTWECCESSLSTYKLQLSDLSHFLSAVCLIVTFSKNQESKVT